MHPLRRPRAPRPRLAALLVAAVAIGSFAPPELHAQGQASTDSRHLVEQAIEAMGGLETLRALQAVRLRGFAEQNMLEQSERPEGPYIVLAGTFEELRVLDAGRLQRRETRHGIVLPPDGSTSELVVANGLAGMRFGERVFPAGAGMAELAAESLALGPERVLLSACAADDLRGSGMVRLYGVEHDVVDFSWGDSAVSLYLNAHTRLPAAIERVRVFDDGFWGMWGDVTARVEYSLWHLEPGGLSYPRQWTESRNGMPYRDQTIVELELDAEVPAATFELPDDLAAREAARADMVPHRIGFGVDFGGNRHEPVELAPGLWQTEGTWNVGFIEQANGILVLEAPISSRYSEQALAEVARRFPGRPIKGVISTSDAWPHLAGVREYVAQGVPVYAFPLTVPLLERVLEAPHTRRPDRLAGRPGAEPDLRLVADALQIGEGANRALLYPIRGEGGERMVAVWFPEHRLLYASDLIQPGQGAPFFMPAYLAEVEAVVERHGLDPETVFAMHLGPTPWSAVLEALEAVRTAR